MSGLNKAILVGNLGGNPEMRYTADGIPVTAFSLAASDGKKTETVWYRISCWRGLAELTNKHLSKGQQVYVEGRLHPHEYDDRDGKRRFALDVVAEKVVFLGRKLENGDTPVPDADSDTALDSNGDGLPVRPEAEAGEVG